MTTNTYMLDDDEHLDWLRDLKAGILIYPEDSSLPHAVRALADAGETRGVPAVWPYHPGVKAIKFELTEKGELELIRIADALGQRMTADEKLELSVLRMVKLSYVGPSSLTPLTAWSDAFNRCADRQYIVATPPPNWDVCNQKTWNLTEAGRDELIRLTLMEGNA